MQGERDVGLPRPVVGERETGAIGHSGPFWTSGFQPGSRTFDRTQTLPRLGSSPKIPGGGPVAPSPRMPLDPGPPPRGIQAGG